MTTSRTALPLALAAGAVVAIGATAALTRRPGGKRAAPEPDRPVDLIRYAGLWYEIGRYDTGFERGLDSVTAEYRLREDGLIEMINSGRRGGPDGALKVSTGRAKVVEDTGHAKLKIAAFGPFFLGDYWVLDHDPNYDWSIVGDPSGRHLRLLAREPNPPALVRERLWSRADQLGYDTRLIRHTLH
jgi:apolipoprotein D and lipocalin family protein